jgi:hypothetical protein
LFTVTTAVAVAGTPYLRFGAVFTGGAAAVVTDVMV